MRLGRALLGLLAEGAACGYDLLKVFDRSLPFSWLLTQSQLYGELNRLADDGLVVVSHEGPRGRKHYSITDDGRTELEHWITDVEPDRVRRNEAMLRVFFLGTVGPARARAYLEREAAVREDLEELLATVARDTNWDTSDVNRYGQLVIEGGWRDAHAQAEWARWAASKVDNLQANSTRSPSR